MPGANRLVVFAWILLSCTHRAETVTESPPRPIPTSAPAPTVPADAAATVGLSLSVTPPDAEIAIDGVSHGLASGLAPVIELKPGLYTLKVSREGYASYRAEFSVADKTESFVVHLEPIKR